MSVIVHASDLHFGRADPALVHALLREIDRVAPDLVVLSGDFTQHGSRREFRQAEDFLRQIGAPVICVPGNHDMPRYDIVQRFTRPFRRYQSSIAPELEPIFENDEIFVVGLNTARPAVPHWNWAHGMVGAGQIERVRRSFEASPPHKCRIAVCHHPLYAAPGTPMDTIVWGARDLLEALEAAGVEILLTGHVHYASVAPVPGREASFVSVGAGTATSTRLRGQANGYNLLAIGAQDIHIRHMCKSAGGYDILQAHDLQRNSPATGRLESRKISAGE